MNQREAASCSDSDRDQEVHADPTSQGTVIHRLDDIKRYEITEVYTHPEAKVDIVFVHGMNGHPRSTWSTGGVFWPSQLLPTDLTTVQARILVYGYNADVYAFGGGGTPNTDLMHQHAQSLVSILALERKRARASEHPIIWVAHSLGGVLVKRVSRGWKRNRTSRYTVSLLTFIQALELSSDIQSKTAEDNRSIFVSTYGVIFLGTPHTGADSAKWGRIIQGMVDALLPKKLLDTDHHLIMTLQKDNETLQNVNLHFLDIYQRFKICMVHEAVKTDFKGTKAFVVDQASAAPMLPDVTYFGIEADHSGICKFANKNAPGYLSIATTINSWVRESLPIIRARWDMERKTRKQIREAQVAELLESYPPGDGKRDMGSEMPDLSSSTQMSTSAIHSIASIEPEDESTANTYFIKPAGFRPNSLFVGREAELAEIHNILFDKKRRREGTAAVLIQAMPGGGKTHLARQYVYENRAQFPGGIFWLRAKSMLELAAGYWEIAKKAALCIPGEEQHITQDPAQYITIVREWLNRSSEWLMVLDGIRFDRPQDLRRFLPDTPNTSLIYTSTERTAGGDHHFMNPKVIRLPLLSAREARDLFLLELDKKNPTTEELSYAMDIVQAMEFLPVVIHTGAQQLKATDEPLSKYARSYASQPKLRGLGTFIAVMNQLKVLGWIEALNLIQILCFFSQHIPVEMISLGLRSLDVPVRAIEPITGRSLNNTFKMLNMFALIERNDHDLAPHSAHGSQSSRDMLSDNLDVIRLHSVVQGFFVDTLYAAGQLPAWLGRAVKLFCASYDLAHERITRRSHKGLVEDYRLYQIHGSKLREHVVRHQKKYPSLEDAQTELDVRLERIQGEIDRRTPESSNIIAEGRSGVFPTSIFDRTSSSSDTGPETPSTFANSPPHVSTWGLDPEQVTVESPASIVASEFPTHPGNRFQLQFQRQNAEDDGYDSDNEGVAMTVQPSQRTIKQGSQNTIDSEPWQLVQHRRMRPRSVRAEAHRSVRTREKTRYSDSAGAYRAPGAIDPRVTHETAKGTMHHNPRPKTRSNISGTSSAEVSLNHITKASPPLPRGGGKIQDRRSISQKTLDGSVDSQRMRSGTPSYASPVLGPTKHTVQGYNEHTRPASEPTSSSSSLPSTVGHRSQESAMASLQRIPHALGRQPASDIPQTDGPGDAPITPNRQAQPYPLPNTAVYEMPGQFDNEDLYPEPELRPTVIYPRMEGPVPVERIERPRAYSSSLAQRPTVPDYRNQSAQIYSEIPPSMQIEVEQPAAMSLSTPDIRHSTTFAPGSLFNNPIFRGGYSSQPMSRNISGQSGQPPLTPSSAGEGRYPRRLSQTDSEPAPELPPFSPRLTPTSYEVYERLRDEELRAQQTSTRSSPRLGFARAAMIDRLDDWTYPVETK